MSSALLLLLVGAEVQTGAVRVRHEGQEAEANRIASALKRAATSLPAFTGAQQLEIRARLAQSTDELARLTGLPPTVAAGVIDDEIIFPPARITARFEDLDRVARHEVAHLAVLAHFRGLPRWFIEGLGSLLAGAAPEPVGMAGCKQPGQVLALDALLVDPDPVIREAGYRRAANAVVWLANAAGGAQKLWNALPARGDAKGFGAVVFADESVAQVVRRAATCP